MSPSRARLLVPVLPLALALLGAACASSRTSTPPGQPAPASTPPPAPAPPPSAPPPVASPTPPSRGPVGDYRDVLKLYRANLSEDFIIDRIHRDGVVYDNLGADQIIELRNSGVSERVIQAMLDTKTGADAGAAYDAGAPATAPAPAPRRPPEDRVTIDAQAPTGMPTAIGEPPVVWEGVVRRQPGIVILKNRFNVGRLTYAENQLRWEDARDSSKNLLIPWNAVREQFMTCLKKPGGNECFEWGVRTASGDEYRFRDVTWEQGDDTKVQAIHAYFRSRYPSLVDSSRPVDEK